ncbi:MAG: hypothetical protein HWE25_03080 [Alphaproteobacteria bacterium]|nr:hypothetical protein [Alphaproteobacteria bacterium]
MDKFKNPFGYNAAFSALSGIVIMLDAPWIAANLIGAPVWLFTALGLVLVGFAGLIAFAAIKDIPHGLGMFITLQDGLWVLGTTATMGAFWSLVTPMGAAVIMGVNLIVASFGMAQYRMLKARAGVEA